MERARACRAGVCFTADADASQWPTPTPPPTPPPPTPPPPTPSSEHMDARPLRRLSAASFNDTALLLAALARNRTPTVITGLVDDFPALERWSGPEALCGRMAGGLGRVFVQASSVFSHENRGKPWADLDPPTRGTRYLNCDEFLACSRGRTQSWCYVSTEFNASSAEGTDLLARDLPSDVSARLTVTEVRASPASLNVWLGARGVAAQAHYDAHHNVFVQLLGEKTFTLFPPREALALRLHPEAHPRDRQAQVARSNRRKGMGLKD